MFNYNILRYILHPEAVEGRYTRQNDHLKYYIGSVFDTVAD